MTTIENTELSEILGAPITQQEAITTSKSCPEAYERFQTFPKEFQTQVLEFLQGILGLPVIYDSFFKKSLTRIPPLNI